MGCKRSRKAFYMLLNMYTVIKERLIEPLQKNQKDVDRKKLEYYIPNITPCDKLKYH